MTPGRPPDPSSVSRVAANTTLGSLTYGIDQRNQWIFSPSLQSDPRDQRHRSKARARSADQLLRISTAKSFSDDLVFSRKSPLAADGDRSVEASRASTLAQRILRSGKNFRRCVTKLLFIWFIPVYMPRIDQKLLAWHLLNL